MANLQSSSAQLLSLAPGQLLRFRTVLDHCQIGHRSSSLARSITYRIASRALLPDDQGHGPSDSKHHQGLVPKHCLHDRIRFAKTAHGPYDERLDKVRRSRARGFNGSEHIHQRSNRSLDGDARLRGLRGSRERDYFAHVKVNE